MKMKTISSDLFNFEFITKFGPDGSIRYNISKESSARMLSQRRLILAKYWKAMSNPHSLTARKLLSLFEIKLSLPQDSEILLKNSDPIADLCNRHGFVNGIRFGSNDEPYQIEICKNCLSWFPSNKDMDSYEFAINRHVVNEVKRERRRIIENISLVHSFA